MYFETVDKVLFMDGHGAYVWSAYLFSSLVVLIMILLPQIRLRRLIKRIASKLKAY